MVRFALLSAALVAILPVAFASPVADEATLDKRVTHEGWWMEITYNGITQYGKTRDECEACGEYDIDLSPSLFEGFADLSVGKLEGVEWHFMNKDWSP
ncbi:uncharacterized protein FIBRA_08045 [Fibroporia radiculosa]|uniref:Uncharacterized protein n=1 Tax=Fibroporia radiculosa TaxID=599839 RepID=J4IC53_9APHY|nr:uncharacterized protein FIBRA_08045 [Fibroporia radiculosa]CCM05811.1 predicted protein [Fibroporia radiculosa]